MFNNPLKARGNMTKKIIMALALSFIAFAFKKDDTNIVKDNFEFAAKQLTYALEEITLAIANESDSSIHARSEKGWSELVSPRSLEPDGSLIMVPSKDWCSGFFPGELWYMYEYTRSEQWKNLAHRRTIALEREKYNATTHDMGFKMYCSYGNAYRLTGDTVYRDVLLKSAKTLIKRFNPVVGSIRSWDFGNRYNWKFPVIIDNMLNLELLFWATKETGDSTFSNIAITHANTTLKNHFRPDYSSYHVVDYDPKTGEVRNKYTHQGYSKESAWARGQAWGLYGYMLCYRETGKQEYLVQAQKIATYIFSHANLPNDLIPYWDYDAPEIPNEPKDVSAATCTASALYSLCDLDKENAQKYKKWADTILENLTRSYRAPLHSNKGFLLLHSTGAKPFNSEVDQPLVYADYYFLEALLKKDKLEKGVNF